MSIDETAVRSDHGHDRWWYLGGLLQIRTDHAASNGAIAIIETYARRGYQTPLHVHDRESESIFVIEGRLAYQRGEQTGTAGPGDVVHLPKHIAHQFAVTSALARFLVILTPAGFESFFTRLGSPATAARLPADDEGRTDMVAMAALAPTFGVTLLGEEAPPGPQAPGPMTHAVHTFAHDPSPDVRTGAYHQTVRLLTGAPLAEADTRHLVATMNDLLTRESPDARAAILLGITAERLTAPTPDRPTDWSGWRPQVRRALSDAVPDYLRCAVRLQTHRPTRLALMYLLAHFPEHRDRILAALPAPPDDPHPHARLRRCLTPPDLTTADGQIGKSWPSPLWAEPEPGAYPRTRTDLSPATAAEVADKGLRCGAGLHGQRDDLRAGRPGGP